ncbi:hypothetical protein T484DRAFT_1862404 [Baffinella frigidus]|nr:hypothetical protein T484DRAFT_1862404 [Cryptophyta sp. CCMP2293]
MRKNGFHSASCGSSLNELAAPPRSERVTEAMPYDALLAHWNGREERRPSLLRSSPNSPVAASAPPPRSPKSKSGSPLLSLLRDPAFKASDSLSSTSPSGSPLRKNSTGAKGTVLALLRNSAMREGSNSPLPSPSLRNSAMREGSDSPLLPSGESRSGGSPLRSLRRNSPIPSSDSSPNLGTRCIGSDPSIKRTMRGSSSCASLRSPKAANPKAVGSIRSPKAAGAPDPLEGATLQDVPKRSPPQLPPGFYRTTFAMSVGDLATLPAGQGRPATASTSLRARRERQTSLAALPSCSVASDKEGAATNSPKTFMRPLLRERIRHAGYLTRM